MTKQLYIIDYESAHWCGGQNHCVVWAENTEHAVLEAEVFMQESMRELFSDEYDEDYDEETETGAYDNESAVTVNSVEVLDSKHEHWEYFLNPDQAQFYPIIGNRV